MRIVEADVYGLKMFYDADYAAVDWLNRPDFEPFMRPIMERNKGLFIDAGCNAGFHTLSAASLGMDVIAVDANFLNAAMLHKSISANGLESMAQVIPSALSDGFGITTVDIGPSNSSVGHGGIQVVKIPLDQLIETHIQHRHVSLIKIDTEGHEEFVIRGGLKVIEQFSPTLVFEHSTGIVNNRNVFSIINEIGYSCAVVGKNEYHFIGDVDDDPKNVYMYECKRIRH